MNFAETHLKRKYHLDQTFWLRKNHPMRSFSETKLQDRTSLQIMCRKQQEDLLRASLQFYPAKMRPMFLGLLGETNLLRGSITITRKSTSKSKLRSSGPSLIEIIPTPSIKMRWMNSWESIVMTRKSWFLRWLDIQHFSTSSQNSKKAGFRNVRWQDFWSSCLTPTLRRRNRHRSPP